MSSPMLYRMVYMLTGVLAAIGLPSVAAWFTYQHTDTAAAAVILAVAVVYHLMALTVAMMLLSQYVPDSLPLGPSYMAGHGLLTLGMTVGPLLALPGLVWLFLLPFDEHGHLDRRAWLQLDTESVSEPHHHPRGDSA